MSEPFTPGSQQSVSRQACMACRNQKRKCDKLLPKCGLCTRTGRDCDYVSATPTAAANLEALQTRLAELEDRLSPRTASLAVYETPPIVPSSQGAAGSDAESSLQAAGLAAMGRVPSLLFLDVDRFRDSRLRLPVPTVRIPIDVLAILSYENTVVDTAAVYFDTIHTWMPFISRKRMDLGIPLRNGGPDLAMLFLAMKLITSSPASPAPPNSYPLYKTSKAFMSLFEANGEVSLLCLQAMVLIALYEYGHAVYPAAWMTVGACVRYADMLRITLGEESPSVMDQVTTWTELEERKRLCWAIFVLDRAIALGNRNRVAAAEPPETAALPADDAAWSEGDPLRGMAYQVSTSYDLPQAPFARLCQSAMLASRAIARRRRVFSMPQPGADHITGTSALADEISRFDAILGAAAATDEASAFGDNTRYQSLAPRCLAWSALFVLLDPYCCPVNVTPDDPGHGPVAEAKTPEEIALQRRSTDIIVAVVGKVQDALQSISEGVIQRGEVEAGREAGHLGRFCPLALDAVYCVMGLYCWLCQEGGDESVRDRLANVERFLSGVGERWGLAREYLRLKEYHDDTGQLNMGN